MHLTSLIGNKKLLCKQCRGIRPHLTARGMSHDFSQAAALTWGVFSSYGGNDPSELLFIQRCQDPCLVMRDTSIISSRLGRAIQMLLEVRHETQFPFLVASVIFGFLSIFNKSRASSPFEALDSACLLRYQRDLRTPLQSRPGIRHSLGAPQGIQTSLHLVT